MRKRGEIWLADLNPRRGTEPGKTRPVLIVQAQALLDVEHPSTLVVPLTTRLVDAAEPARHPAADAHHPAVHFIRKPVTDAVFDQRLEQHTGH